MKPFTIYLTLDEEEYHFYVTDIEVSGLSKDDVEVTDIEATVRFAAGLEQPITDDSVKEKIIESIWNTNADVIWEKVIENSADYTDHCYEMGKEEGW
jgi:hypothetical protein